MYGSSCVSTDTPAPTHEQPARTVVQTPVHAGRLLPTAVAVDCLGHNTASDLRVRMYVAHLPPQTPPPWIGDRKAHLAHVGCADSGAREDGAEDLCEKDIRGSVLEGSL